MDEFEGGGRRTAVPAGPIEAVFVKLVVGVGSNGTQKYLPVDLADHRRGGQHYLHLSYSRVLLAPNVESRIADTYLATHLLDAGTQLNS